MTLRVIVDVTDDAKAELLVEAGRLKTVGFEHDLLAASGFGFALDRTHEQRAMSLPPQVLRNEQVADVAGSSPGPPKGARKRRAIRRSLEQAEEISIRDAGCFGVKLVKAIPQEAHVLSRRLGLHREFRVGVQRVRFHESTTLRDASGQ
jgi:hypothetical protein